MDCKMCVCLITYKIVKYKYKYKCDVTQFLVAQQAFYGLFHIELLVSWLSLNEFATTCRFIHWNLTHITSFCLRCRHMFRIVINLICWLMQATAEANNLAAVASAKDQYYKNMEKVGMWLGIGSLRLVSIKKKHFQ